MEPIVSRPSPETLEAADRLQLQDFSIQRPDVQADDATGERRLELVRGGERVQVTVRPHSVRTDDHRLLISDGKGGLVEVQSTPSRTFRGRTDQGGRVAATRHEGGWSLAVSDRDGSRWYAEPARRHNELAPAGVLIVYDEDDVVLFPATCGNTVQPLHAAAQRLAPQQAAGGEPAPGGGTLQRAQLGVDADFEYFQANGSSIANTQAAIEEIVNALDIIYSRDVGVRIELSGTVVRTTSADPYTATDSGDILDEFRFEWDNNISITHDAAQLFSGKEFDGSIIGLAFIDAVCLDEFKYGVNEVTWTGSLTGQVTLVAHELGHNFSGRHCNQDPFISSPCNIMCASINGCDGPGLPNFGDGPNGNVDRITSNVPDYGCLDTVLNSCSDGSGIDVDTDLGALGPGTEIVADDTSNNSSGVCAYSFFSTPIGRRPASGPDYFATFTVTEPVVASANIFSTPDDIDVYLLNGNFTFTDSDIRDDGSGLSGLVADDAIGAYTEGLTTDGIVPLLDTTGEQRILTPGTTYYLVFDGFEGAEGFFDIDFILETPPPCSDGSGLTADEDLGELSPGRPIVNDNTSDDTNGICAYSFFTTDIGRRPASGPEYVASFTVSEPVRASADIFSTPGDIDVYLLNGTFTFEDSDILNNGTGISGLVADDAIGAYIDGELADGDTPLLNTMGEQEELVPGTTYYLVFDGFEGAAGFFDIDFVLERTRPNCPPGGALEFAFECSEGFNEENDTNGGCNSVPAQFGSITPGLPICGQAGTYTNDEGNGIRDTDWYELNVSGPTEIEISMLAEFDSQFGVINWITPGVPGCDNQTGSFQFVANGSAGTTATLTATLPAAGTYYIFAAPSDFSGVPCGSNYTLNVEAMLDEGCNSADLATPFGILDGADVNAFITAFGAGDDAADLNGDSLVDGADVNVFITQFGAGCP